MLKVNTTIKLCFLYFQIQEMINENETLPENERLELWEFNLDVEEQKRLDAMVQEEVTRVMYTHKCECNDALILL